VPPGGSTALIIADLFVSKGFTLQKGVLGTGVLLGGSASHSMCEALGLIPSTTHKHTHTHTHTKLKR
jgi:hypothetical protein